MLRKASFTVPGEPQAWQRVGVSKSGKRYVPRETKDAKQHVAACFQAENVSHDLIEGPVALSMWFYTRNERTDWDNYGKLISDALNMVAYRDDRQIERVEIFVNRGDDNPETIVLVEWNDD
jgi:Holliday junction resolvase RusA-like endonuclease